MVLVAVAVAVVMLAYLLPRIYVSEADVRKGLGFTLPPEVEYVETHLTDRMAYFSVPADLVDELSEIMSTVQRNGIYVQQLDGLNTEEKRTGIDPSTTSRMLGAIVWSYVGGGTRSWPEHTLFLTREGGDFYFWYQAGR